MVYYPTWYLRLVFEIIIYITFLIYWTRSGLDHRRLFGKGKYSFHQLNVKTCLPNELVRDRIDIDPCLSNDLVRDRIVIDPCLIHTLWMLMISIGFGFLLLLLTSTFRNIVISSSEDSIFIAEFIFDCHSCIIRTLFSRRDYHRICRGFIVISGFEDKIFILVNLFLFVTLVFSEGIIIEGYAADL